MQSLEGLFILGHILVTGLSYTLIVISCRHLAYNWKCVLSRITHYNHSYIRTEDSVKMERNVLHHKRSSLAFRSTYHVCWWPAWLGRCTTAPTSTLSKWKSIASSGLFKWSYFPKQQDNIHCPVTQVYRGSIGPPIWVCATVHPPYEWK